jgi:hypothetical protein
MEAKESHHRLIKKKRIAQFINRKLGKTVTARALTNADYSPSMKLHDHLFIQTNTPLNTLQPKTPDTWINTSQIHPTENAVTQKSNSSTKPPHTASQKDKIFIKLSSMPSLRHHSS